MSPQRHERHREYLLLALVFLLALCLRGIHCWGQWQTNPYFLAPTMDEYKHHVWAQQIATGEGLGSLPFFRGPLYYLALAALYKAVGPNIILARAIGCVIGATSCLLIALMGRSLAGLGAGLVAGLLAAVYWPFIHFDQLLLTVVLETFLSVLLLIVFLAAVRRERWWLYLSCGILWGLAAITRPTVLTFAPVIALWIWFGPRLVLPENSATPTRLCRLRNVILVGVAAGMTIAPVTLNNRLVGGDWVLVASSGGINFFIGNNARADGVSAVVPGTRADWDGGYEDTHAIAQRARGTRPGRTLIESEVSDYWYAEAWKWIRSSPGAAIMLTLRKLARFWAPVEIPNNLPVWFFARQSPLAFSYWIGFPVVAVLGIAGLSLFSKADWRAWCLPASYFLVSMFTVIAFFVVDRYRMPVVPVLMVAAGAGLTRLPRLWSQGNWKRLTAYAVVALIMIGVEFACRPGAVFWREGGSFRVQDEARGREALGTYYAQRAGNDPEFLAEALKHYQAAADALPALPGLQVKLGHAMMRTGKPESLERAGAAFELAVRQRPSAADARQFYAHWLYLRNRRLEAIEQYRIVVELQPWGEIYQEALLALGVALVQEGRHEEAETWLLRAMRNDPRHSMTITTFVDVARWLREHDRPRDGIALLNLGLSHAKDNPVLLSELRIAYSHAGESGKAAEVEARSNRPTR